MGRGASFFALLVVLAAGGGCRKSVLAAPPIAWRQDVDAALASAWTEHKPVLVFVGADWDTGTKSMQHRTFVDPEVRRLVSEHFVSIHVDVTDDDNRPELPAVQARFKVVGVPTLVIYAPDATTELVRFHTVVDPPKLARFLRLATTKAAVPADRGGL